MFCCLHYLNYKHPSSFAGETKAIAKVGEFALDCTYGTGGHSIMLARQRCKVRAFDCDIAALVSAQTRRVMLQARVDLRKPTHELVMVDAGMSLAQAKLHWRQFSNDCRSGRSANTLTANTRTLFKHIANTLAIGGKLLLMFYSLEFALLAFNLSKTAPVLYLLNRSVIRASYVERTLLRCASSARLLVFVRTR